MSRAQPSGPLAAAYVAASRLPEQIFHGNVEAARERLRRVEDELDAVEVADGDN